MPNHPNRKDRANNAASNPTINMIQSAREASGLTQSAAAALLYSSCAKWQAWESGEQRMHPALFELFLIKVSGGI